MCFFPNTNRHMGCFYYKRLSGFQFHRCDAKALWYSVFGFRFCVCVEVKVAQLIRCVFVWRFAAKLCARDPKWNSLRAYTNIQAIWIAPGAVRVWMRSHINCFACDVITHPCPRSKSDLIISPIEINHGRATISFYANLVSCLVLTS